MNKCQVSDCTSIHVAKGLCDLHYRRLKRHGHLKKTRPADWGDKGKHPLYNTWLWMKRMESRFSICDDWKDFWKFVDDVGSRPSSKHQLRRVDSNGNYSPDNCKWVEVVPNRDRSEYAREWRRANPEKVKNNELKKMFGITLEDYNTMVESQGGVCGICKESESFEGSALAVDHCHDTGKVRGLLCSNCNRAIGMMKDNVEILKNAIIYLES